MLPKGWTLRDEARRGFEVATSTSQKVMYRGSTAKFIDLPYTPPSADTSKMPESIDHTQYAFNKSELVAVNVLTGAVQDIRQTTWGPYYVAPRGSQVVYFVGAGVVRSTEENVYDVHVYDLGTHKDATVVRDLITSEDTGRYLGSNRFGRSLHLPGAWTNISSLLARCSPQTTAHPHQ